MAGFDEVDRELSNAEVDASQGMLRERPLDEIERVLTTSSTTPSEANSSLSRRATAMSRIPTQRELARHPTELSRIQTGRSLQSNTVGRSLRSKKSTKPLPSFGGGKPYPPALPAQEEYVVEFDGPEDPLHAQNWPMKKKLASGAILGYTTMTAAFGSSIFSPAIADVAAEFGVSDEVALLGLSLYVLGFATGPTLWAPLSELRGRKLPIIVAMFGFSIFSIAVATAKDLQTVMICRFFAGFFGACPLAVVAAVFSDMFDNRTRGLAIAVFTMAVFSGPLLAPFIGGFISTSYLGWRWTQYLTAIMGFLAFGLDLLFMQETYAPVILVGKAAELRRRTLNWGIHAKQEEIEVDVKELATKNFTRPLRLLFFEPIVLLVSIYLSFVYGLLYGFLTAYPLIFEGVYGFNEGQSGLAFFGMIVGELIAGVTIVAQQPWYQRKLRENNGIPVPEWRLPVAIAGSFSFAGGIFWLGWSGYTGHVPWIVPVLSGLLSGFGLLAIFLQCINYLVDAYLMFAASALAGNTFMRSIAASGFPLFATYMFDGMGIQWASTLLGCVAVALIPIPIVFYYYGERLRRRSSFAPTAPLRAATTANDEESKDEDNDAVGLSRLAAMSSISPKDQQALGNGV